MPGAHPDNLFRQGSLERGDHRVGTCYGRRSATEYNRIVVAATEKQEGRKVSLLHYARMITNDDKICEFVVVNGHLDPGMKVYSRVPGLDRTDFPITVTGDPGLETVQALLVNGQQVLEEWPRLEEDGQYVFHAPPGYQGGPIAWFHRKDLLDESIVYSSGKTFWQLPRQDAKEDVGLQEKVHDKNAVLPLEPYPFGAAEIALPLGQA